MRKKLSLSSFFFNKYSCIKKLRISAQHFIFSCNCEEKKNFLRWNFISKLFFLVKFFYESTNLLKFTKHLCCLSAATRLELQTLPCHQARFIKFSRSISASQKAASKNKNFNFHLNKIVCGRRIEIVYSGEIHKPFIVGNKNIFGSGPLVAK